MAKELKLSQQIWHFSDYKSYLKTWAQELKKRSGVLKNLSEYLKVHPSRLSKILNGSDHPSIEQAYLIGQFLGLSEYECRYLIELVNLERSSSSAFTAYTQGRLQDLRRQLEGPSELTQLETPMSPADERTYHSSHRYGAVWLASTVSSRNDLNSISQILNLEQSTVKEAAEFLVRVGLCKWNNGRLVPGPREINIESDSDHLESFLSVWRLHSLNKLPRRKVKDFFFSQPMAIGLEAEMQIRNLLNQTIQEIHKILIQYPSDKVRCLNIDFFDV